MAQLSELAKELGATTKFTAKESADAMGYMAMAGWNAQQMMEGMPGVLQLAATSGEDLAQVSDIVTDSMTAFGLTAADTAHYADVLAATATNANTNVATMGETFKYAAPVAGALKYSIEDVSLAVGLMANAGVKGSNAGTALRNVFNGLLEGVTLTGEAFGEMEYTAVRADGSVKDFRSTIDDLRTAFEQMTEADRVNNAMAIAGQRGYAGLLSILNATEEDYAKLAGSINDCTGAAQRMASIRLDNVNGQLTLMNSEWEAVKTTIGEEFTPELEQLYSLGADVLAGVNQFIKDNPGLVKGLAVLAGGIGAVTAGVVGLGAAIKVIKALDLAALLSGPAGIAIAAVGGLTALTAAVVGLTAAANDGIPSVKELTEAASEIERVMRDADDALTDSAAELLATTRTANLYLDALDELQPSIDTSEESHAEYKRTLQLLAQTIPELADKIDLETGAIEGGTDALRADTAEWEKNAKAKAYNSYLATLQEAYNDVLAEQIANEIKLTAAQNQGKNARDTMTASYNKLLDILGMTEEQFTELYGSVQTLPLGRMTDEVKELQRAYVEASDSLNEAQKAEANIKKAMEESAGAVKEAKDAIDAAEEAYRQIIGPIDGVADASARLAAEQLQDLQGAISGTADLMATLAGAYTEAYNAALQSVEGQYDIWDMAAKVIPVSVESLTKAMQSQIEYWQKYSDNLAFVREQAQGIEGLDDIMAGLADGSAESINAVAGIAQALRDGKGDIGSMVSTYQDLKAAQAEVSDSMALTAGQFGEQLAEIQKDLEEAVKDMDVSELAAESGASTIQAFIDQARNKLPQVQRAYEELAKAAARSLAATMGENIGLTLSSGQWTTGFATGTDNAPPGLALVGERGPELVMFGGGKRVFTAEETAYLRNAAQIGAVMPAPAIQAESALVSPPTATSDSRLPPIQIHNTITIEGNVSQETMEQLDSLGEHIRESVEEALADIEEDRRRQSYR